MATVFEREKNRLIQEKCQNILSDLLKDEDNKYCVDCDAKSPRWASWNIGIFLCIRCAGIHRKLGVHISRVKSVNLDSWTPQHVACIQHMGNSRARAVYEANLPDNFRRPQTDAALEQFVRNKYETKKYIAKEWVQPPMPNPTWGVELEKQLKRKREKKAVIGTVELPALSLSNISSKTKSTSPKPLPPAPGGRSGSSSPAQQQNRKSSSDASNKTSASDDLLGLDVPTANGTPGSSNSDPFGEFLTAASASCESDKTPAAGLESVPTSDQAKTEEEDFFNQKQPESLEKMTRDSILALYGQHQPNPSQSIPVYGCRVPGTFMGIPQPGGVMTLPQQVPTVPTGGTILPKQGGGGFALSTQTLATLQQLQGVSLSGSHSSGNGAAGPSSFFGGTMPPCVQSGVQGMPAPIQLSASNPFAQVQAQMNSLSLSGSLLASQQPNHFSLQPHGGMVGSLGMHGPVGVSGASSATTTLAPSIWQ